MVPDRQSAFPVRPPRPEAIRWDQKPGLREDNGPSEERERRAQGFAPGAGAWDSPDEAHAAGVGFSEPIQRFTVDQAER